MDKTVMRISRLLMGWLGLVLVCLPGSAAFAQTTGTLTINGLILNDPTCDLAAGDVNRQVTLENVAVGDFSGKPFIAPKLFTLTANCQSASSVTFAFTGTPDPVNATQFKNTGTASGVALALFSINGSNLDPIGADGTSNTRTVTVSNNVASLDLGAAYWNLGRPTAGTLVSQALVSITYQ